MAKKKSFSHIEAQDALEQLGQSHPSGEEIVYELLRIFCGYGDGNLRRIREGVGNKAKDGRTVLIANTIAYRPKGDLDFYDEIKAMQTDRTIVKQSPRLYVVSDGHTIVAYDPKEQDEYNNQVELLWKDFEFFYPLAGIEKFRNVEEAEADVKSAELMAKIFDEIRRYNDIKDKKAMHYLNVFMSRLLFCFFAEDTNLFPEENLFTNSLRQHTAEDGHDLRAFIDRAFLAMSTNIQSVRDTLPNIYAAFPYVNGGLFEKRYPIPVLSRRTRVLMLKCGDYNWADINPDIFGSMIQAVVTPEMRAGLGMHYTSVPNIMKLIRPLFLDELHEEYQKAVEARSVKKLSELLARMSKIKFFDPACGSGNFLIISYKQVRELEIQIWKSLTEISGQSLLPFSQISLTQFYGIEIDEFACDTATLSLWLAEHQMNNKFHEAFNTRPDALPLRPSGHIVCGNACRLDWNVVCPHTAEEEVYVMGNPPYLGYTQQDKHQKEDIAISWKGYGESKNLDYISAWFIKSVNYIKGSISRSAFVSTNSICQGESVATLWKPIFNSNIDIFFAYKSFKWENNAKNNAGVTCTIVGLVSNTYEGVKYIYDKGTRVKVDYINAYLLNASNVIVDRISRPISNVYEMSKGSMPADGGYLILTEQERDTCISEYPESIRYIKAYIGSQEFIRGENRFCLWIEDVQAEQAMSVPFIKQRVNGVKEMRLKSPKSATVSDAQYPYRFSEIRYKPTNAIIVPSHSSENREYIPIGYVGKDTIIPNSAFAIYDAELWLLSILTSKMHNTWVRAVGGALETRIRYSATLCYNTFPFPKITDTQKTVLEELAQDILDIRDQNFDMTLGEMYNPETMPEELREAHHRLDLAVERCYRPEPFTSDEERLEYLFKLYVKMTKNK